MITKADAISAINPTARYAIRGETIEFLEPMISDADIESKQVELQAEYDSQAYARARAEAYATTWADHVADVKARFPK
jgi:hypothetical protein